MRLLIALPVLATLLASCRTSLPIDPNTGKPSTRCLPYGTTTVYKSSK